jgi:diguanylate cyclase
MGESRRLILPVARRAENPQAQQARLNVVPALLLADFDWWIPHLPPPVALALVALIGYLVGRMRRAQQGGDAQQARRELKRAQHVAQELEKIADSVRRNLADHHASVVRFRQRVVTLGSDEQSAAWQELCREAESMLKPTMRLATQLAQAYDEIRQQTNHLLRFTEVRTDPLTGVSNRRALDEALAAQFALMTRYETPFAVVIMDIDHFKRINDERGHLFGDKMLKSVAALLGDSVRETDVVSRYGGEEFVIVLPQTDLAGASGFADRVRRRIAETLPLSVSAGVATALDGDDSQTLLARADAALYSSKAGGRNCVYYHTGIVVDRYRAEDDDRPVGKAAANHG